MKDGGPAFPGKSKNHPAYVEYTPGMSLRDYFATWSESMGGDCSPNFVADALGWERPTKPLDLDNPASVRWWFLWWRAAEAAWKYTNADAMLAEREKP